MTRNRSISNNELLVLESPQEVYSTEEPVYDIVFPGVTTIPNDATLSMTVYRGPDDVTSTYASGSFLVNNNVVTLKKLSGLVGGDVLHITLTASCDGLLRTVGLDLYVKRLSGR